MEIICIIHQNKDIGNAILIVTDTGRHSFFELSTERTHHHGHSIRIPFVHEGKQPSFYSPVYPHPITICPVIKPLRLISIQFGPSLSPPPPAISNELGHPSLCFSKEETKRMDIGVGGGEGMATSIQKGDPLGSNRIPASL
ncbi:hypothetical protein JTE90_014646 [Oedothorax gibbosus]|uniref:Uncharacterized protein n=1 Tax=Oedothorax gibbosus TaxID=931172 RepID=A0AAV6V817_9ARAC|nr:hypothetical protein JTE90_014646 [Oedothorax gibbosus]